MGFMAAVVEKWNPHARVRQDLWGFGDVVAIKNRLWLIVQACNATDLARRVKKIQQEPRAKRFLQEGGHIVVMGWRKRKKRKDGKLWTVTIREMKLNSRQELVSSSSPSWSRCL